MLARKVFLHADGIFISSCFDPESGICKFKEPNRETLIEKHRIDSETPE